MKNNTKCISQEKRLEKITITTPLKEILGLGLQCERCGHCCSHGSGFLVREDHGRIAEHLSMTKEELREKYLEEAEKFHTKLWRPRLIRKKSEKEGKKGEKTELPYGRCVFLEKSEGGKEKLCSIHKVKPLQCRIGSCSEHGEELNLWFNLRHFLNENDPESVRQYAAYLNAGGKTLPGAELGMLIKDRKKLEKILNYGILR